MHDPIPVPCETRLRDEEVLACDAGFKRVRRRTQTYTGLQAQNRGRAIKSWMKGAEFRP